MVALSLRTEVRLFIVIYKDQADDPCWHAMIEVYADMHSAALAYERLKLGVHEARVLKLPPLAIRDMEERQIERAAAHRRQHRARIRHLSQIYRERMRQERGEE